MKKKITTILFTAICLISFCASFQAKFSFLSERTYSNDARTVEAYFPLLKEDEKIGNSEYLCTPLYYKKKSADRQLQYIFYPLFRNYAGEREKGISLYPLFWSQYFENGDYNYSLFFLAHAKIRKNKSPQNRKYYLFPLLYRKQSDELSLLFRRKSKVDYYFPLYFSTFSSEKCYIRSYLLNSFMIDENKSFKRWSFFYPFLTFSRGKSPFYRIFPLYIHYRLPSYSYTSFLFPFFIHIDGKEKNGFFSFPFYMQYHSPQREFKNIAILYLKDEHNGEYHKKFHLFPLWGHETRKDRQIVHFLYPLGRYIKGEAFTQTKLRPLFDFYKDPAKSRYSLLNGIFSYQKNPKEKEWFFTPLCRRITNNKSSSFCLIPLLDSYKDKHERRFRLLGPLFSKTVYGHEKTWGYFIRLFNYERVEDHISTDALFHLFEWEQKAMKKTIRINLLLIRMELKWE